VLRLQNFQLSECVFKVHLNDCAPSACLTLKYRNIYIYAGQPWDALCLHEEHVKARVHSRSFLQLLSTMTRALLVLDTLDNVTQIFYQFLITHHEAVNPLFIAIVNFNVLKYPKVIHNFTLILQTLLIIALKKSIVQN
jgi:hypothetical protein